MFNKPGKKVRALDAIAAECREVEQQLGQKEYVKRVIEAEQKILADRLLGLNREAKAAHDREQDKQRKLAQDVAKSAPEAA